MNCSRWSAHDQGTLCTNPGITVMCGGIWRPCAVGRPHSYLLLLRLRLACTSTSPTSFVGRLSRVPLLGYLSHRNCAATLRMPCASHRNLRSSCFPFPISYHRHCRQSLQESVS